VRWATVEHAGAERVGIVDGDECSIALLPAGARMLDVVDRLDDASGTVEVVALDAVRVRAPIPRPPSVRDFYAFEQHVRTARERRGLEMDPLWYELPVFYFSNPHCILGPGDVVRAPTGCAELDYELEVAAVLDSGGRIAGYTVMNDWSARDVQRREMRLNLGPAKGKDFATSLGPYLVTPDEVGDRMTAEVNGVRWSEGRLSDLHFAFEDLVAHAARDSRVVAGDVIGSGTVGSGCILELSLVHGSEAYPWLRPGDEVVLTVEGLGSLANRVAD
jgi:2-keto-4-pentenoate hydratase/2-oxohepta-3-ene-1,7-dioic acid hydratase in catechol pathway